MNKTVTINISGIIFHIEEDAYESLSKYLSTIKGYFSKTEGGNEIMADIEARIAELLQEKISPAKQVIVINDVVEVKQVMGKPEDFDTQETNHAQNPKQENFEYKQEKIKRRLFRDPDERAIGGVCSGLAAYFDVDAVWIRVAMFLLIFFGGLSLWVYIILWMVIPQAKTTADKFAMRGEPANINNIYQSFKDEAEDVKSRFAKNKDTYKQQFRDAGNSARSNSVQFLNGAFNFLGRMMGMFLLLIGGVLLFAYIMTVFGISFADSSIQASNWKSVIFDSSFDYALAIVSLVIVFGIPVFMMIYAGIKLLFRIRYSNRWLNLSLGLIWVFGLILSIYVTLVTVKQFGQNSKLKEVVELNGLGDTIVIKLNPAASTLKDLNFDKDGDLDSDLQRKHHGYHFGESLEGLSILGFAGLDVIENNSDSVELVIYQSAKGNTKKEANENAKAIHYSYSQKNNTLFFDEIFSVIPGAKFRAQALDIKLKLPIGKVIYFDKSVKYLLDDVENTTNTWDGDMINRRWKMTEKGLKCIDCDDLESVDEDRSRHKNNKNDDVEISEDGIKVNGEDAQIRIDKDGIEVKTKKESKD